MSTSSHTSAWVGWIWFASIVLITVGLFNVIDGIVIAFAPDKLVGVGAAGVIVFDAAAWGWFHLIFGAIVAGVGFALLFGQQWARMVAIVLVVINALSQFTMMQVTPWWSIATVTLDVFVLWALIVHGEEAQRAL